MTISMKKRAVLIVSFTLFLLVFLLSSHKAQAASYYAAPNGSGSTCNQSSPCTLGTLNQKMQAGDTALLKPGDYEEAIRPQNSGASSKYITYKSLDTNKPAVITNVKLAVELSNRSYIKIDNLLFDGKGEYQGSKITKKSNIDQWLYMDSAHHNIIANSTFTYANGYGCFRINNDSHHNEVLNNSFDGCGTWDANSPQGDGGQYDCGGRCLDGNDSGDLFRINCSWSNLVEGNNFNHGGHDLVSVHGWDNVVRGNIMQNAWTTDPDPNNYWGTIGGKGNRCGSFTWHPTECAGAPDRWKHGNLFENNIVKNAMPPSDQPQTSAFKMQGINVINRRNQYYNNNYMVISTTSRNKVEYNESIKVYHNVFFNNGSAAWSIDRSPGWETLNHNTFKNNIVYHNRQAPLEDSPLNKDPTDGGSDFDLFFMLIDSKQRDNTVIANSFVKEKPGDALISMTDDQKDYPPQSITSVQKNYPNNFKLNIEKLPRFVSDNPDKPNFQLRPDSPMIDAGDHLTRTKAGGSGKTIPVRDAAYFFDGFDIVQGDLVQVGSNLPVRVTAVDYPNNTLTISKSITWKSNDGVSLPYEGNAPDIGAFEFGGSAPPPEPPEPPPPDEPKCGDTTLEDDEKCEIGNPSSTACTWNSDKCDHDTCQCTDATKKWVYGDSQSLCKKVGDDSGYNTTCSSWSSATAVKKGWNFISLPQDLSSSSSYWVLKQAESAGIKITRTSIWTPDGKFDSTIYEEREMYGYPIATSANAPLFLLSDQDTTLESIRYPKGSASSDLSLNAGFNAVVLRKEHVDTGMKSGEFLEKTVPTLAKGEYKNRQILQYSADTQRWEAHIYGDGKLYGQEFTVTPDSPYFILLSN